MRSRPGPEADAASGVAGDPGISRSLVILLLGVIATGCATQLRHRAVDDRTLGWTCQLSPKEDGNLWVNEVLGADDRVSSASGLSQSS